MVSESLQEMILSKVLPCLSKMKMIGTLYLAKSLYSAKLHTGMNAKKIVCMFTK